MLHRARRAVRGGVVADGGALPRKPGLECPPDRAMEPPDLVVAELPSRSQRVDAGSPERLVGIDVPHAGERPLVEERGLHRRSPIGEPRGEAARREAPRERLLAETRGEKWF